MNARQSGDEVDRGDPAQVALKDARSGLGKSWSSRPGRRAGHETIANQAASSTKAASIVWAALRLDASISAETGMYLVAPWVVPLVKARNGIRPGHVRLSKIG